MPPTSLLPSLAKQVPSSIADLDRLFAWVQDEPQYYREDPELDQLFAEIQDITAACVSPARPPPPPTSLVRPPAALNQHSRSTSGLRVKPRAPQFSRTKASPPRFNQTRGVRATRRNKQAQSASSVERLVGVRVSGLRELPVLGSRSRLWKLGSPALPRLGRKLR